jgi:two-component system response regulator FixJ
MQQLKTHSKVFLVDDDDEIRLTLSRALSKRGFTVETFGCAKSFLDTYDSEQPGCLVLDYGMPELNGLELQLLINEQGILIPIIFISGHGGVLESVQAMKAGATDFLEKPFRQNTLVACIEAAFEKDMAARTHANSQKAAQEKFGRLTTREQEIASYMMANPSHTASKEISRELKISPRTVDHHRARILEKMEMGSVAELMEISGFVNTD